MSNEYKDWLNDEILDYATEKHKGQLRKYTNEPYINHPVNVAQILTKAYEEIDEPFDLDYINGLRNIAFLHDTVEDTDATVDEIRERFGEYYASMVQWLTNVSKPSDGNRSIRKKIDLDHILSAPVTAIIVKLADIYDNCKDLEKRDPDFAKVYFKEKLMFIKALKNSYNSPVEDKLVKTLSKWCLEVLEK